MGRSKLPRSFTSYTSHILLFTKQYAFVPVFPYCIFGHRVAARFSLYSIYTEDFNFRSFSAKKLLSAMTGCAVVREEGRRNIFRQNNLTNSRKQKEISFKLLSVCCSL